MSHPFNSDPQTPPPTTASSLISRQLHNFTSFIAPPPQHPYSPSSSTPPLQSSSSSFEGLKNDLAEIGDSLKLGLSLLSPKKAVTGISRFASSFLQQADADDVVGVTDDVVDFVRGVSLTPESWIDFPLSLQNKDFSMSQVQKGHAAVIQDLVPNLATLRHTIHNFMSEQQFWMIYFILLVPRLNEDDRRLLLTPEIFQMHEMLLQKPSNKHTLIATEDPLDEKDSMVNMTRTESSGETDNAKNMTRNKNHEDDVCFSEIEDEEFKQTQSSRVSSASENSDWVRIGGTLKANRSRYRGRRSESEGSSSDWHAVEDLDL